MTPSFLHRSNTGPKRSTKSSRLTWRTSGILCSQRSRTEEAGTGRSGSNNERATRRSPAVRSCGRTPCRDSERAGRSRAAPSATANEPVCRPLRGRSRDRSWADCVPTSATPCTPRPPRRRRIAASSPKVRRREPALQMVAIVKISSLAILRQLGPFLGVRGRSGVGVAFGGRTTARPPRSRRSRILRRTFDSATSIGTLPNWRGRGRSGDRRISRNDDGGLLVAHGFLGRPDGSDKVGVEARGRTCKRLPGFWLAARRSRAQTGTARRRMWLAAHNESSRR